MNTLFKVLGDQNRLRIINLLLKGELCVCELEAVLDTSQSNISRHLTKMRNEELVVYEKKAQWIYYQINPIFIKNNELLCQYLIDKMKQQPSFSEDLEQLALYKEGKIHCSLMST